MRTKSKFSIFERTFSWLLSVVMIFGIFVVGNISEVKVNANDFIPRMSAPNSSISYYYSANPFYKSGYGMPNCTCYAYGRAYELLGSEPNLSRKNAGQWWYYNKKNGIYDYGSTPKLGAVACWDRYDEDRGHVAVVEAIDGNSVTISESHYQSTYFDTRVINADSSNYLTYMRFLGYIYIGNFNQIDFPGAEDTSYAVPVSVKAKQHDNTYDDNGNIESNRWIDEGDDCYIEKVYTNGFCRVEYPAGNDRRWAYAKASLFDVPKKANKPSATYVSVSAGTNFAPTSFWWNASENVDHYDLKIWNGTYWEGDAYKIEWGIKGTSCSLQLPTGYYEAYVDSVNSEGCTMSENVVRFTVGDEKIDIGTDFYAYIINTSAQKMVTVIEDNVQLQTDTGQANQVWYFERQNDLSYKISNAATNNCLDVYGDEKSNGTNIFAGCSNDQDNQRWYFTENDGNYVIHPKHAPNMAFDVNGASTEDGANIQIWETNGTSAQDFNIRYLGIPKSTTLYVFEGNNYKPTRFFWDNTDNTLYYNIKVYKDKVWDGELVASGTNLTEEFYSVNLPNGYYEAYVDSCNTFTHTMSENVVKFTIIEGTPEVIDTNFYAYIVNTATNSYLINDNGNVCFNKTNSINENQKVWYFTKNDNDSFTIKSMYDNKVLDVYMDKDENGTNVQTFNRGENYANQQWYFQGVAPYYYIKPAFTDRVVLDLNGGKYYDNVNAQVWEKNGTDAQKFKLVEVNYSISYDMNGGNGSISSQTKAYGQELILSSTIPTRNDYKFIGWNTDKNAASAQYQAGDKYTSNGNATLYAIWQINHNYTTKIFAPTCTEKGYTLHTCSVCGDSYKDTYTNATGHDFGEWIVITVPTSANVGEEQRICSICRTVEKRSLVLKHIPGDINNDGVVNNKDFSRLFQYLSGWNVVVNEAALDVNGDGSVNNKDATRLFQYVSGWNVNIY